MDGKYDRMSVEDKQKVFEDIREMKNLMRRMGEHVPDSTYNSFEQLIDDMRPPFVIEEGLIKTYPADRVVNSISRIFNLKVGNRNDRSFSDLVNGVSEHEYNGSISIDPDTERVKVILDKDISYDDLCFYFKKYGWLCSEKNDSELIFDKKFDIEINAKQLKHVGIDYLYHFTLKSLEDKIFRQGLVPKFKGDNGFTDGDDRLYFFINEPNSEAIKDFSVYKFNDPVILLKIDVSRLNPIFKFHRDPRMDDAIYTHEPINPNFIEKIDEYPKN